jgi:RNA methyltransferase, TrmH family
MPIRIVQSKQNARLKELRRALESPGRKAAGLVGIEGPHLIGEALRTGLPVRCVFVGEQAQHWVEALELSPETEVLIVPSGVLAATLTTETPQLVAALVEPPEWTWANVLGAGKASGALVVVLAGIQDPGNLGTILRSAEAFGADGVVCLPGTVNAWNPKAVRSSAGSVFRVPVLTAGEDDAVAHLRKAEVRLLTTTVDAGEAANLADLAGQIAFLIGNEGSGVPADLAVKADGAVTIPCPGPVESLNAAVAASVLLYEAARQRGKARHRATGSDGALIGQGGTR